MAKTSAVRKKRRRSSRSRARSFSRTRRSAPARCWWSPATAGTAGVSSLAPFGAGNPRPVFAARGVEIIDGPRKLKERHLKMALRQDGRIFRAIAWRAAERHESLAEQKGRLDVAFSLEQNQY